MSDQPTTQEKLRMLAAAIATGDEIVDRQLIVKDLLDAAKAVEKGDLGKMDSVLERFSGWNQMLSIRHAVRTEELRAHDTAPP